MDLKIAERLAMAAAQSAAPRHRITNVYVDTKYRKPDYHELVIEFGEATKPTRVAYPSYEIADHVRNVLLGRRPKAISADTCSFEFGGR